MPEIASVLLLRAIETASGNTIKEGTQGTLIEREDDGFVIEFQLNESESVDTHHFETAILSPESFAITELLENTPTTSE